MQPLPSDRTNSSYSTELGSMAGPNDDPNHIHYVAIGRLRDEKILLTALTNRGFNKLKTQFDEQAI